MNRRQMLARAASALAAWNRGDPDGIVVNVVEDVIWRDVALGMPLHGREALKAAAQTYMTAFPDLRIEETSSTLAAPRLAQELTITGTHRGELLGVPPTGRWTESYAAVITTFDEDGMMIEGALYWNALELMRQLGVIPPRETAQIAGTATRTTSRPSNPAASAVARSLRAAQLGGATTRSMSPAAT
jgi:steroid delta-isomerase-like uncharacterized protein